MVGEWIEIQWFDKDICDGKVVEIDGIKYKLSVL